MATNVAKRVKIRALEAKRDTLSESKRKTDTALKLIRAELKHVRKAG